MHYIGESSVFVLLSFHFIPAKTSLNVIFSPLLLNAENRNLFFPLTSTSLSEWIFTLNMGSIWGIGTSLKGTLMVNVSSPYYQNTLPCFVYIGTWAKNRLLLSPVPYKRNYCHHITATVIKGCFTDKKNHDYLRTSSNWNFFNLPVNKCSTTHVHSLPNEEEAVVHVTKEVRCLCI